MKKTEKEIAAAWDRMVHLHARDNHLYSIKIVEWNDNKASRAMRLAFLREIGVEIVEPCPPQTIVVDGVTYRRDA